LTLESHDESSLLLLFRRFQVIHDFRYSYFLHFLYYGHWVADEVGAEGNNKCIVRKPGYPSTEPVSAGDKDLAVHIHHR
jgi:hypothetical protein